MSNTILVSIAEIALNSSDTSGENGDWALKDMKRATVIYESQQRIQALEDAAASGNPWTPSPDSQVAQIPFKKSRYEFLAPETRLDVSAPGEMKVVNGVTVHELSNLKKLHFGDGYIPIVENTAYDLQVTAQMSSGGTNKKISLTVEAYDQTNTKVRTATFADLDVPDDTSPFTLTLSNVIENADVSTASEFRFELIYSQGPTTPHNGSLQFKRAEVVPNV